MVPEPQPAPPTPPTPGGPADVPRERCGTLAVEHHVKDDGRPLILYTRAGQ